jgi:hypothetical protein
MTKRDETAAEREWHELKAELLGRPRESLDLFDIERSIQERLSAARARVRRPSAIAREVLRLRRPASPSSCAQAERSPDTRHDVPRRAARMYK